MKRLLLTVSAVCGAGLCLADPPVRPAVGDGPPVIGAWFWKDDTLEPGGFRSFLDLTSDWMRLVVPPSLPDSGR